LLVNGGRVEGSKEALQRRKMPIERRGLTHHASVGGFRFYITAGLYDDGTVGEIFIKGAGKEGSTIQGLLDGYATMWSIGAQYGADFDMLVRKFAHRRFEPLGETDNPDIPWASSFLDYIARWLAFHFGSSELNDDLNKITDEMRRKVV
jgi:ribonucleoside-diphosphate reductase alpha chain